MRVFEGYQKGINLGGWLSQCVSYEKEHFDNFITEADIRTIAEWGLDHVRLPIDYDIIETQEGEAIEEGFAHIDDCIGWCKKYGLHIVLDLHKAYGFMFDKSVVPDPDKFFTDESLQDRFMEIWRRIIKRYGQFHEMMAYELLNEVVNPAFYQKWNQISQKAIRMIREYEPDAYIIIGGVRHNNVLSVPLLDRPYDDHIIYNFHCYEPLCFTHQRASWVENIEYTLHYPDSIAVYQEKSRLLNQDHAGAIFSEGMEIIGPEFFERMFRPAIDKALEYDVPLYCGEYGVIDQAPLPDSLRWLQDIHTVFEKYGIGKALWNYKQKDFGMADDHYRDIRNDMIRIMGGK